MKLKEFFDEEGHKHFVLQYASTVKRRPKDQEDWGDEETIGVCVKTRDPYATCEGGGQFGRYLGNIDGKYYIGTFLADAVTPGPALYYESIEQMKVEWVLD